MKILTFLPEQVRTPSGKTLKPVIGAKVTNIKLAQLCKKAKINYRMIGVLPSTLRSRKDYFGQVYTPTVWFFCSDVAELKELARIEFKMLELVDLLKDKEEYVTVLLCDLKTLELLNSQGIETFAEHQESSLEIHGFNRNTPYGEIANAFTRNNEYKILTDEEFQIYCANNE